MEGIRQFLLYSGIVALKRQLGNAFYNHFLLLFVSIYILANPMYAQDNIWVEYADQLLCKFVTDAVALYGREFVVYNVHGLTHLAGDVKNFGPLDRYSAFPFENYLGQLKHLVRAGRRPLQQVVCRYFEMQSAGLFGSKHKKEHNNIPMREHFAGPVPRGFDNVQQFCQIHFKGFFYSVADGNNCIKINNSYCLIRNILSHENTTDHCLVVEQFRTFTDFFAHYPLNSSSLGIVKVTPRDLSGQTETARLADITCKCFMIPYKRNFILVPLNHTG